MILQMKHLNPSLLYVVRTNSYSLLLQLLHMKISRLEHLVKIKDIKIAELTKQTEAKQQHSHPKR